MEVLEVTKLNAEIDRLKKVAERVTDNVSVHKALLDRVTVLQKQIKSAK